MARRLGFLGKSCIHPRQIAPANDVFRPNDEEIARAQHMLDAWRRAGDHGAGAILVDGKMIDAPFVRRAEMIVAAAGKWQRVQGRKNHPGDT